MEPFSLKQKVKITATGVDGEIVGIWHDAYGEDQFQIRYYTTTNERVHSWMVAEEIESIGGA